MTRLASVGLGALWVVGVWVPAELAMAASHGVRLHALGEVGVWFPAELTVAHTERYIQFGNASRQSPAVRTVGVVGVVSGEARRGGEPHGTINTAAQASGVRLGALWVRRVCGFRRSSPWRPVPRRI